MFSDMLKCLRKREGLTQEQLAKKLGVSRGRISMYEIGQREPDFETLEAIADCFNVSMSVLIDDDKKPLDEDGELAEALEILRGSPETRALLHATKGMKPAQIQQMTEFIKGFRNGN